MRTSPVPGAVPSNGLAAVNRGLPLWLFWMTPRAVRCAALLAAVELVMPAPFQRPWLQPVAISLLIEGNEPFVTSKSLFARFSLPPLAIDRVDVTISARFPAIGAVSVNRLAPLPMV